MGIRSSHAVLGGLRRLIAAAASAALALLASPAHAEPAMWVVKDADSTIYLLGTFHLTKPEHELAVGQDRRRVQGQRRVVAGGERDGDEAMLQNAGASSTASIRSTRSPSKLSGDDWAKVQAAAKLAGVPGQRDRADAPLAGRPYARGRAHDESRATTPRKAPTGSSKRALKARSKIVKTFETPEQQLLLFVVAAGAIGDRFLIQTLDEIAAGPTYVDRMATRLARRRHRRAGSHDAGAG